MALKLKLLNEKVVKSAKEMLKKVRNDIYITKKLNAVIATKKVQYNRAVAKACCTSRTVLTT